MMVVLFLQVKVALRRSLINLLGRAVVLCLMGNLLIKGLVLDINN
jgi:hypothetical protein